MSPSEVLAGGLVSTSVYLSGEHSQPMIPSKSCSISLNFSVIFVINQVIICVGLFLNLLFCSVDLIVYDTNTTLS